MLHKAEDLIDEVLSRVIGNVIADDDVLDVLEDAVEWHRHRVLLGFFVPLFLNYLHLLGHTNFFKKKFKLYKEI